MRLLRCHHLERRVTIPDLIAGPVVSSAITAKSTITVHLTASEVRLATRAAARRCELALERASRSTLQDYQPGMSPGRVYQHTLGALGECAFAKAFGIPWDGSESFGATPDVGGCEVRTRGRPYLDLSFKSTDVDDRRYVLVQQIEKNLYHLVGWATAKEGRVPKYFQRCTTPHGTHYDIWYMPPADLHPLASLELPHIGRYAMSG